MFRNLACASLVLAVSMSVACAEEFMASISKVEDGKITFAKRDFKKKEKGEAQTLPVATDVKVVTAKFNKEEKKLEAGDKLEGGLKNEKFTKIGEKGLFAQIVTDADNKMITEIRVFDFSGFKKKKKDN